MDKYIDAYDLLSIPLDADTAAIKKAYKKLSLKLHPDKVKPAERKEAAETFNALKDAYDILSDDERKRLYDGLGVDLDKPETQIWAMTLEMMVAPAAKFTLLSLATRIGLWLLTFPYVPSLVVAGGAIYRWREIQNAEVTLKVAVAAVVVAIYAHSYFTLLGDVICLVGCIGQFESAREMFLSWRRRYKGAAVVGLLLVAWFIENWWWYICIIFVVGVVFLLLGALMSMGVNRLWLESVILRKKDEVRADRERLRRWRDQLAREVKPGRNSTLS